MKMKMKLRIEDVRGNEEAERPVWRRKEVWDGLYALWYEG